MREHLCRERSVDRLRALVTLGLVLFARRHIQHVAVGQPDQSNLLDLHAGRFGRLAHLGLHSLAGSGRDLDRDHGEQHRSHTDDHELSDLWQPVGPNYDSLERAQEYALRAVATAPCRVARRRALFEA